MEAGEAPALGSPSCSGGRTPTASSAAGGQGQRNLLKPPVTTEPAEGPSVSAQPTPTLCVACSFGVILGPEEGVSHSAPQL